VAGEPDDLRDIHALRVRGQVADLHIVDHATLLVAGFQPCQPGGT
jgi:hypothetical protein